MEPTRITNLKHMLKQIKDQLPDTKKYPKPSSKTCHMHRDLWPILILPQSIWTSVPPSQYQVANHHDLSHQQVHHHRKSGHVKNTYLMHWHKQAVVAMSHPWNYNYFSDKEVVSVHRKWVVSNTHLIPLIRQPPCMVESVKRQMVAKRAATKQKACNSLGASPAH